MLREKRPSFADELGLCRHEVELPWSEIWPQKSAPTAGKSAGILMANWRVICAHARLEIGAGVAGLEGAGQRSRGSESRPKNHAEQTCTRKGACARMGGGRAEGSEQSQETRGGCWGGAPAERKKRKERKEKEENQKEK